MSCSSQKGGKYIGSGAYGCVFNPHLKCKEVNNKKQTVGKVFENHEEYEEEFKVAEYIQKKVDPKNKFTIPLVGSCQVAYFRQTDNVKSCDLIQKGKKAEDYHQVMYKYAGKSLEDILKNKKRTGTISSFLKIFKGFGPILQGIKTFQENSLVHSDIKPANIMMLKDKLYLIDFGLLCKFDELFIKDRAGILVANYPYFPPEFKAFGFKAERGFDRLYELAMANFESRMTLARALTTTLKMKPKDDLEKFFTDKVPKKAYIQYAGKADIYGLGLVLFQLFLWSGFMDKQYKRPGPNSVVRDMIIDMIRKMLHFDPRARYTIDEAIAHHNKIQQFRECMKRPAKDVLRTPSARNVNPKNKLTVCITKVQ
jgi:serine/threonine protein kinase